ncbi:putative phage tail protein [Oscillibacter sp.]|uniref:putative phage tail protein n=1 Tax=Oscillibacter sp. TaxID=1945593 RepID=UPI001B79A340|nr:putative phage tail protein [Oscillibacter sp.]MBP3509457.1 DUF2313 domain-containing protein [Oscillibacter sp.]
MRLPKFVTELSPVRETLEAIGAGETAMADAVAEKNAQVCLASADEGLSLWERDYGLPVREGASLEDRRAAVRAAMAGGRTLTPALLRELCITLGGADRGEVTEEFPNWRVTAEAVSRGRIPENTALLERAVEKLKPAHLEVLITPRGELPAGMERYAALTGGVMVEVTGDDIQRGDRARYAALTGGVMVEIWGA